MHHDDQWHAALMHYAVLKGLMCSALCQLNACMQPSAVFMHHADPLCVKDAPYPYLDVSLDHVQFLNILIYLNLYIMHHFKCLLCLYQIISFIWHLIWCGM